MLTPRSTWMVLLAVPLLVGCGRGSTGLPSGLGTAVAETGNVSGQFIAVGGPVFAQSNPQQGTVSLTNTSTKAVFSVKTGPDGLFAFTVPVGTYTATGLTPQYQWNGHEALCQDEAPVRVYENVPVAVTVACQRD